MSLAWVSWTPDRSAFEVATGSNRFYEIYLSTRPELMRPSFAGQRTPTNWFSSRAVAGMLLPSSGGRALFPLPQALADRFGSGSVCFMVKTYADAAGASPARSPVMAGHSPRTVMTDVDPDATGDRPMQTAMPDLEELAARIPYPPRTDTARTTARTDASSSAHTAPAPGDGRPARVGEAAALALALTCGNLKAVLDRDATPRKGPSLQSVVDVLSTSLAYVPAPPGPSDGPSVAAVCNGIIAGRKPYGGSSELARHILRAASTTRTRSLSTARAREQFFPALAAIAPMLLQALPTILPVIMPLIQNLLGGLAKGKSLSGPAAVPAPTSDTAALIQQLLAAVAAAAPRATPGTVATPATNAPAAPAAPPGTTAVPAAAAPVAVPPAAAQRPAAPPPAMPTTPPVTAAPAAAPAISPADTAALLGALQGAAGGDGGGMLGGLVGGGPGHELVKSVVDRLPIEKMFDGQAWIPKSNYDEWRSTLPWEAVLSISDPTATIGALYLPGRGRLQPLPGVQLALVERRLTPLAGAGESWCFLANRPARIRLEVLAGPEGLSRPFVDVRVSREGTPRSGLWRSAFRLRTLGPRERRVAVVELPPEVLARCPQDGSATCLSLRVVQQSGDTFAATELRARFHVVAPHTLIVDGGSALEAAPELDDLRALERRLLRGALAPEARTLAWNVEVVGRSQVNGLGRYGPVTDRVSDGDAVIEGSLLLSPLGLADLARRRDRNALTADDLTVLADALDQGEALRRRLSLRLLDDLEPTLLARARTGLGIRTHFGWLDAWLVTFSAAGADGSPTRREVRRVALPVPRGITLRPV